MALTTTSFLPLSALANSDAPRMFSYGTADNAAVVEGANYFDNSEVAGQLQVGDVLLAYMGDATKLYNFTTVDNTAGAPNVVISTGTAIA
jgi:hypothetical protein